MLKTEKQTEYYAVCKIVDKGIFDNERVVVLGLEKEWLTVDKGCLGLTKAGLVAAQFSLEKIEDGIAYGCVYNCQDGAPSGMRNIPLDDLTETKDILPYDGKLVLANFPAK
jgi:hypothetical protein